MGRDQKTLVAEQLPGTSFLGIHTSVYSNFEQGVSSYSVGRASVSVSVHSFEILSKILSDQVLVVKIVSARVLVVKIVLRTQTDSVPTRVNKQKPAPR